MPDFNPEEILGEGDSLQWSSPLIALAAGLFGLRFEAGMFGSAEKMLPTNLVFRKLDRTAEGGPFPAWPAADALAGSMLPGSIEPRGANP